MRRFLSRARGPSLATLLVSALGACNGDPPTQPAGALLAPLGAGRAVTVIAENDAPLWFARLRPDSAASLPVRLGDVRLRGAAGDSVILRLQAGGGLLASVGPDASVVVEADGKPTSYALARLSAGALVYRFAEPGTVWLRYSMPRNVAPGVPRGEFRLTERTTASVDSINTPWVPRRRGGATAALAADVAPPTGSS